MSWPIEVSVLDKSNIHKGGMDGPNGTHCLIGWKIDEFPRVTGRQAEVVRQALKESVREEGVYASLISFNDSIKTSKSKIARVWNRAMATLGYTEGNPEAGWSPAE